MISKHFLYHNFLSENDCDQIINESQNSLEKATVMDNNSDVRNSKISWYNNDTKITNYIKQEIRKIAKDLYRFHINTIAPLQYTFYDKNMFYNWHVDSTDDFTQPHLDRDLSASILLNHPDEYIGGALELANPIKNKIINLKKGSIVVFPSLIIHRVKKVEIGTRHSLVAWGSRL